MADDLIPEDVKQFIVNNIDSVAELEGLLLCSLNPETGWNAETLAQRLYINSEQAESILERLYAQGFLAVKEDKSKKYYYHPRSQQLGETADRVAEVYSKYLVPVTNLIHSKPQPKVQQFADAFKFINKEDE